MYHTELTVESCEAARAGLQTGDVEIGKWLRKHAPHVRVQVLLNKAEGIHRDVSGAILANLAEAHALGFGDPLAVSAETGEGLSELFHILQPWMKEFSSGQGSVFRVCIVLAVCLCCIVSLELLTSR